ncbi:MAG: hypothetical protein U1E78_10540 [Gammaproteobacteria bacterium]
MSDDDKKKPDDFEDEFDFDDETFDETDSDLDLDAESTSNALKKEPEAIKQPVSKPASKPPVTIIITVLVVSFLGWKGYQWFSSPKVEPKIEQMKSAAQTLPQEPALPSVEMPTTTDKKLEPSDLAISHTIENVETATPEIDAGAQTSQATVEIAPTPETTQRESAPNAPATTAETATSDSDEEISGAAWLATEQDLYGIKGGAEEIAKSKLTVSKLMKKLEAQEENTHKRIKVLEDNLAELIQTVTITGKNVNQMGLVVDDLSKTIDTLTKEVVALKDETVKQVQVQRSPFRQAMEPSPVQAQSALPPGPTSRAMGDKPRLDIHALGAPKPPQELERSGAYAFASPQITVHAMIPGRAWLKGKEGRIMTVTEGDYIEGYGKVIAIDAGGGVVITSSGLTLR